MQSGVFGHPTIADYRRLAETVEQVELDALVVGAHLTFPRGMSSEGHGSNSGEGPPMFREDYDVYEIFTLLAHLLTHTDEISMGTNVMVAPYRNPVALTKTVFTLDALSESRFEFGVGVGWSETEYDVLGVPFEERGSRTDEFLEIFDRAKNEGICAYSGKHYEFPETGFYPTPDSDQPSIWIGGACPAAYRRLAKHGDGWTAPGLINQPDDVRAELDMIEREWHSQGRSGKPDVSVMLPVETAAEDEDYLSMDDTDSALETITNLHDAGVSRVLLTVRGVDSGSARNYVRWFGDSIAPSFN